ncbi:MAG: hypothetical protein SGBAC_006495 [Bacillariaceae sp.]
MTFQTTRAKEVAVASRCVTIAAKLCEAVRLEITSLQAMTKSDKSPVTIADFGAQCIIGKSLRENFPQDELVAEEDAHDLRTSSETTKEQLAQITIHVNHALKLRGTSNEMMTVMMTMKESEILDSIDHGNGIPSETKRYWTCDPIDGTKGFLRGDQYANCLALVENGSVVLGVMACPALDIDGTIGHLFIAEQGNGAWRRPLTTIDANEQSFTKIHVNGDCDAMVQSFVASHGNHSAQEEVAHQLGIENVIRMDSQAKYAMVASGKASLYLRLSSYKENIWDHAAGKILVEEAGGKVTDRHCKELGFLEVKMMQNDGVVVSNGALHEKVLEVLQKTKD